MPPADVLLHLETQPQTLSASFAVCLSLGDQSVVPHVCFTANHSACHREQLAAVLRPTSKGAGNLVGAQHRHCDMMSSVTAARAC